MFSKILDFLNDLRPRQILMLAGGATVIMFLAVYLLISAFAKHETEEAQALEQPEIEMQNVVVVSSNVAAHTVLTENLLQIKEMPVDLVPEGALTNFRPIVGKSAGVTMYAGDIVTEQKIYAENLPNGFVDVIPKDCRAISVGIGNITGVGGFAKAGDYVDVILVQKNEQSANSRLILQNVLLLSINKQAVDTAADSSAKSSNGNVTSNTNGSSDTDSTQEPEDPNIATLALTPQQTMELVSAAALGEIYLALRPTNPIDTSVEEVDYTMYALEKPSASTAPAAPAPAPSAPVAANVPSIPLPSLPAAQSPEAPPTFEIIQGDKVVGKDDSKG